MTAFTKRFWNESLGSSIVDWAVFAAGVMSLGIAMVSTIS